MCTALLPTGGNPIAVKYIYHIIYFIIYFIIYHITSHISYDIISYYISYYIISFHIISHHIICHVMSCHIIYYIISYHIISKLGRNKLKAEIQYICTSVAFCWLLWSLHHVTYNSSWSLSHSLQNFHVMFRTSCHHFLCHSLYNTLEVLHITSRLLATIVQDVLYVVPDESYYFI